MSHRKCPNCDHEVSGKSKFCANCGTPLTKSAQEKVNKTSKGSGKSNSTRDGIIIVAVLAVIVVGYFIINRPVPAPVQQQQQTQQGQITGDHPDVGMEGMMGEMLANMPVDYDGLVTMGNQTMDAQNYPVAAECYKRALSINGSNNDVRTDYGACLHGMSLPDRALEEFNTVLRNDPTHKIAIMNKGIVFYTSDRPDSARVYWEKYLVMDPNGDMAQQIKDLLTRL